MRRHECADGSISFFLGRRHLLAEFNAAVYQQVGEAHWQIAVAVRQQFRDRARLQLALPPLVVE
jgi:hypothetical protein